MNLYMDPFLHTQAFSHLSPTWLAAGLCAGMASLSLSQTHTQINKGCRGCGVGVVCVRDGGPAGLGGVGAGKGGEGRGKLHMGTPPLVSPLSLPPPANRQMSNGTCLPGGAQGHTAQG